MQKIISLAVWLFLTVPIFSQSLCGTTEYMEQYYHHSTEFWLEQQFIERQVLDYQQNYGLRNSTDVDSVYRIKVVVHILYHTAAENFSNEQVDEQIEETNFDLRKLNTNLSGRWPQAADTKIELELAAIVRKQTYRSQFFPDDAMKNTLTGGLNPWSSEQYLNVWVCHLNGRIGYATRPGTSAEVDGIVIDYRSFGVNSLRPAYNLGRTLTHELGHYLGLYHTYHGGCDIGDRVEDTPATSYPSFGCQPDRVDCEGPVMVENFMDASHDACLSVFTKGQKIRMRAHLAPGGARHRLLGETVQDTVNDVAEEEQRQGRDTIDIDEPPIITCAKPENFILTNNNNVLEVSWDPGGANNFLFEFKLATSDRWLSIPVRKSSLRVQGIQESWSYSIRLTKICTDGTRSEPIERNYGDAFSRIAVLPTVETVSIYDLSGRYYSDLSYQEYQQRHFNRFNLGLNKGIYILVKKDAQGKHLGTEKWAVL